MITKKKLSDIALILLGLIYLIGLWLGPTIVSN